MRIIMLTQWYWPEPVIRQRLLAKGLVERGHEVLVITGFPNYPGGRLYPGYRQRLWTWEQLDGVRILRLPLYPSHDRSSLRRMLNYFSFALSASLLGPLHCGRADVMWVYHPPLTVGIPAWWISLLRHIPFVYEIQDMWPETVASSGMMSSQFAIRGLGALARFIYSQAAAITVISPGFKNNLIGKGVPPDKIVMLPNWGNDDHQPVSRDDQLGADYGLVGLFNVMFAGNMGLAQALPTVIEAAALLRDLPKVRFVLIGDGIDLPSLRAQAQQAGLDNVCFIDRQPSEKMPAFFAWADALLVQLRNDPLFAITIPSKTQTYLAAGKPILCGVPGDGADIVRNAGAGLVFEPENAQALAQAVRQLYAMSADKRAVMGRNGQVAYQQQFSQSMLIDRYIALFQKVARVR